MNTSLINLKLHNCFLTWIILLCTSSLCYSQRLIDQTYMVPMTYTSSVAPYSTSLSDGARFIGKKKTYYTNGKATNVSLYGTITFANGDKFMTSEFGEGLDLNFKCKSDIYYYLTKDGILYNMTYRNGNKVSQSKTYAKYYIQNNCIHFYANGSYVDNGSSSYESSSSSSNVGSNRSGSGSSSRMCTACYGRGKCRLCSGNGRYMPSISTGHYITCTMCNGSGRCTRCGGTGRR